jgi:signal transduction histidine kinase
MNPPVDIRQAEGLRRLSELMLRVNSSADLPEVLDEITSGVVEVLGYELAFITEVKGAESTITAVAGSNDMRSALMGMTVAADHGVDGVAGRVDCIEQFMAMMQQSGVATIPARAMGSRLLCKPLVNAEGELLGCLGVFRSQTQDDPGKEEQDLLEAFASQAGLALHNLQSRSALGKRLRLGDAIRALAEVSELDNLEETLRSHGPELNKQFEVDLFRIRILKPDEDNDDLSSTFIIPPSPPDQLSRQAADQIAKRAAEEKRPLEVCLKDGVADPDGDMYARGRVAMEILGLSTCLICPITVGNQYYGYVTLGRSDPNASWDEPERDALMDLGRNLGRLRANWRLLERERELVEELQALDRYRTELIATISHELKTPLTAIIGHVELLEDSEHEDISISAISRNAQRLDRLVANLLTYSHALHSDIGDRRLVDFNEVVSESVDLIRPHAESGHVGVQFTNPNTPNWVFGDPEELGKVVINLLSNAVKYSRPSGHVEVTVEGNETYREVTVTDHGIGISESDLLTLFSAFNRSSNQEVLSIPGTGLGLAISRRIAQMNGGEILVDSELGAGSSFRFRLPARVPAEEINL